MIHVENLRKRYRDHDNLRDISFDVDKGEVISLIGPSGCGKSTLLRCIIGLEPITSGSVSIDGMDIAAGKTEALIAKKRIGMVFQHFNLFSHLMVIENIMLGPVEILGMSRQEAYEEAEHLLELVGLAGRGLKYPNELSGGQQQRVAIARTLAMHPDIILFDEPTSALDPTMVGEVLAVIKKLADDGMTMMIATHEMSFAKKVSTRVMYLDEHTLYEDGPPSQVFDAPQRPRTREFIYKIRNFNYHIDGSAFDLFEFQARMEAFLHRQMFAEKRIHNHQLVSEEVIFHMLFPLGGTKNTQADFSLSYSAELDTAEMVFESPSIGEDFLERCDDDLAMMIIGKYAKSLSCENGKLSIKMKSRKELG